MSGKKGRSGRLPRAIELARSRGKDDALSCVRRRLPQILEVIVQKAEAGDKECAIYCVDRLLGRPRLELDQRLRSVDVTLDPAEVLQALRDARSSVVMLPLESDVLHAERQLASPTRDMSHAPYVDAPFCEEKMSPLMDCATSPSFIRELHFGHDGR